MAEIIAIVGATGTGKSALAIEVAHELIAGGQPAEIVNADAMQLYRGMNIGTAKLARDEQQGIAHHLIDVLNVTDEAAVAWYQTQAREVIDAIHARGATAILVGGSGLYVSSVLFDFEFPGHDDDIRARLERELAELAPGAMFARLKDVSPETANRIDQKNERRIIRALEVIEMTGASAQLGTLPDEPTYWRPTRIFGLARDREELIAILDARVVAMWESGLVDEVRSLIPDGLRDGVTARRAIGYAQALAEIDGEMTRELAIEATQALTRRYARRQVSWFKRYADLTWLPAGVAGNVARVLGQTTGPGGQTSPHAKPEVSRP
jgi:tRNA dimethylallyltransferase